MLQACEVECVRIGRFGIGADASRSVLEEGLVAHQLDRLLGGLKIAAVPDLPQKVVLFVLQILKRQLCRVHPLIGALRSLFESADGLPHAPIDLLELDERV